MHPTPRPRSPRVGGGGYARTLVESGPLPPHERPWRHPSELAAATRTEIRHERPSGFVRGAALLGGTTTAVLMGFLVLSLTPERAHGPTVTGSVPIRGDDSMPHAASGGDDRVATDAGPPDTRAPATGVPTTAVATGSASTTPSPVDTRDDDAPVIGEVVFPIATIVGGDGTAVAPSAAVLDLMQVATASTTATWRSGMMIERISRERPSSGPVAAHVEVTLADGSNTTARVLDAGDGIGLALVQIVTDDDPGRSPTAHELSGSLPEPGATVVVLADDPVPIPLVDLLDELDELPGGDMLTPEGLPYPDGTPVLDTDGRLLGVLACNDEGMELVTVIGAVDVKPVDDATARAPTPGR